MFNRYISEKPKGRASRRVGRARSKLLKTSVQKANMHIANCFSWLAKYSAHCTFNDDGLLRYLPVFSPITIQEAATVKSGADDFTVSTKEAATAFRLTSPNITVMNLNLTQTNKDLIVTL